MSHNEKAAAAFKRFSERTGQSYDSPSDLERIRFAFESGWRAYHRAHKGRGTQSALAKKKVAWRAKLDARAASPVSELDRSELDRA